MGNQRTSPYSLGKTSSNWASSVTPQASWPIGANTSSVLRATLHTCHFSVLRCCSQLGNWDKNISPSVSVSDSPHLYPRGAKKMECTYIRPRPGQPRQLGFRAAGMDCDYTTGWWQWTTNLDVERRESFSTWTTPFFSLGEEAHLHLAWRTFSLFSRKRRQSTIHVAQKQKPLETASNKGWIKFWTSN